MTVSLQVSTLFLSGLSRMPRLCMAFTRWSIWDVSETRHQPRLYSERRRRGGGGGVSLCEWSEFLDELLLSKVSAHIRRCQSMIA